MACPFGTWSYVTIRKGAKRAREAAYQKRSHQVQFRVKKHVVM
jgi:hypothetical protein